VNKVLGISNVGREKVADAHVIVSNLLLLLADRF
jgi:hypothetical protein